MESNGFEDKGGYPAAKKIKLDAQFEEAALGSGVTSLFSGISIHVNGYTNPPESELKSLMIKHGGTYHHWARKTTTYIVANSLASAKIEKLKQQKVIKPDWIVESVKAGKLLDYKNYLLFTGPQDLISHCVKIPQTDASIIQHGPALTAADPHFIEEYQKCSRLHHISQMASKAKDFVASLRQKEICTFPGTRRLYDWKMKMEIPALNLDVSESLENFCEMRVIMHIDIDCFFASVAMCKHPELENKPVAVAHGSYKESDTVDEEKFNSMAEIASCNYIARKHGIRNGMFVGEALKLCPYLHIRDYSFEEYEKVSQDLYSLLSEFTLEMEAVSCDEVYVDITNIMQETNSTALEVAAFIKREMKDKTGCTATTGLGPSRLIARLATKLSKPDGMMYVKKTEVREFMCNIKVEDLPGIGYQRQKKLHAAGFLTCCDLQKCPQKRLQKLLGNNLGKTIHLRCWGIDETPLIFDHEQKSVSVNINFGVRLHDLKELEHFLRSLTMNLYSQLEAKKKMAKTISLKMMIRAPDAPPITSKYMGHGPCTIHSKSWSLLKSYDEPLQMYRKIYEFVKIFHDKIEDFRGFSLAATHLVDRTKNQCNLQKQLKTLKQPGCSNGKPELESAFRKLSKKKESDNISLLSDLGEKTATSLSIANTSTQDLITGTNVHEDSKLEAIENIQDEEKPEVEYAFQELSKKKESDNISLLCNLGERTATSLSIANTSIQDLITGTNAYEDIKLEAIENIEDEEQKHHVKEMLKIVVKEYGFDVDTLKSLPEDIILDIIENYGNKYITEQKEQLARYQALLYDAAAPGCSYLATTSDSAEALEENDELTGGQTAKNHGAAVPGCSYMATSSDSAKAMNNKSQEITGGQTAKKHGTAVPGCSYTATSSDPAKAMKKKSRELTGGQAAKNHGAAVPGCSYTATSSDSAKAMNNKSHEITGGQTAKKHGAAVPGCSYTATSSDPAKAMKKKSHELTGGQSAQKHDAAVPGCSYTATSSDSPKALNKKSHELTGGQTAKKPDAAVPGCSYMATSSDSAEALNKKSHELTRCQTVKHDTAVPGCSYMATTADSADTLKESDESVAARSRSSGPAGEENSKFIKLKEAQQHIEAAFNLGSKHLKKLIYNYLMHLVKKRRIEELFSILMWLRRKQEELNDLEVNEAMQHVMRKVLLAIREQIDADLEYPSQ